MNCRLLALSLVSAGLCCSPPPRCYAQTTAVRKGAQEIIEALGKYSAKRGTRELAEELAELGGETAIREVVERVVREGGDDALAGLTRLTRSQGPDAVRAAVNAPNIPSLLRVLDELPEASTEAAIRRLAAGSEGRVLAEVVEKYGLAALEAEIRHPGVGGSLVRHLGDDGAALATRLSTPDAIQLGRHAQDISRLPATHRAGVLRLLHDDAKRLVAFMGRFAEQHPGKVLFTAATTAVVMVESDRILGGADIAYDDQGRPYVLEKPGVIERMVAPVITSVLKVVLPAIALGAAGWIGLRLWHLHKVNQERRAATGVRTEHTAGSSSAGQEESGVPER